VVDPGFVYRRGPGHIITGGSRVETIFFFTMTFFGGYFCVCPPECPLYVPPYRQILDLPVIIGPLRGAHTKYPPFFKVK